MITGKKTSQEGILLQEGELSDLLTRYNGKILSMPEIQAERAQNGSLRAKRIVPGDGILYGLKNNEVWLYIVAPELNPANQNPTEFVKELVGRGRFYIGKEEASKLEEIANSTDPRVEPFNLSSLFNFTSLKGYIGTKKDGLSNYILLPVEQLVKGKHAIEAVYKEAGKTVTRLVDRVYGDAIYGRDGLAALLHRLGGKRIAIVFPGFQVIKGKLGKSKHQGELLARAPVLDSSTNSLTTYLSDRKYVKGPVTVLIREDGYTRKGEADLYRAAVQAFNQPNFDPRGILDRLTPLGRRNFLKAIETAYRQGIIEKPELTRITGRTGIRYQ